MRVSTYKAIDIRMGTLLEPHSDVTGQNLWGPGIIYYKR